MASSPPASNFPVDQQRPTPPSSSDAYLLALKSIDLKKDISNLPSMPCSRQSLLLGIGGGVGVGAIRFLSSRRPLSSSNWAVLTFSVLSLTSWEICRRSHASEQASMRAAVADYKNKVKAKSRPAGTKSEDISGSDAKVTHVPAVGGVMMGARGQEMLREKEGGGRERLV